MKVLSEKITSCSLRVVTVLGEPVELPPLSHAGLGTYRVRCRATW